MINRATELYLVPELDFVMSTISERLQSTQAAPGTMLVEQHPNTPKHCPVATVTKALCMGRVCKLKHKGMCVYLSVESFRMKGVSTNGNVSRS